MKRTNKPAGDSISFRTIFCTLLCAVIFDMPAYSCVLREGETVPTATIPLKYESRRANVSYHFELLNLALKKAEAKFGPCEARIAELYLPSARLNLHSVEQGLVDVVDTTTSHERDLRLLPIRIPLLKGLMGYRILFIRKGEQPRFAKIRSMDELKKFKFGQGQNWPDNKILEANGLHVIPSTGHNSLMKMLLAKRFDAYPRGAQQILVEQFNRVDNYLDIEQSLGLAYVSPAYFHVGPYNVALAQRISFGLNIAIEDGSFDALFYAHPLIQGMFNKLDLDNRHYFYLCHPNLNPETPTDKPEYWWRPWPNEIHCKH